MARSWSSRKVSLSGAPRGAKGNPPQRTASALHRDSTGLQKLSPSRSNYRPSRHRRDFCCSPPLRPRDAKLVPTLPTPPRWRPPPALRPIHVGPKGAFRHRRRRTEKGRWQWRRIVWPWCLAGPLGEVENLSELQPCRQRSRGIECPFQRSEEHTSELQS